MLGLESGGKLETELGQEILVAPISPIETADGDIIGTSGNTEGYVAGKGR